MRWTPDDLTRYRARRPQGLANATPALAPPPTRKRSPRLRVLALRGALPEAADQHKGEIA